MKKWNRTKKTTCKTSTGREELLLGHMKMRFVGMYCKAKSFFIKFPSLLGTYEDDGMLSTFPAILQITKIRTGGLENNPTSLTLMVPQ